MLDCSQWKKGDILANEDLYGEIVAAKQSPWIRSYGVHTIEAVGSRFPGVDPYGVKLLGNQAR